ncbi:MAG: ABC transporter ATP-binding protein [Acidimicrobiales bacterium]
MVEATPLLEARSVSKLLGAVPALDDVSLTVAPGEILGLIGPNGAGKTTLFNCLNGQLQADRGTVTFAGVPINHLAVYQRARLGIARTYQRLEVFPEMAVRDHLFVACRAPRDRGALWRDLLRLSRPTQSEREWTDTILDMVGLTDRGDTPVAALSLGHCRMVELGRAIAGRPRLLMADEPTSALDVHETEALSRTFAAARDVHGIAILLVEHDLDMVAGLVDRAVVLNFGHQIAEGTLEHVLADPEVRTAYLGTPA